MTDLYLTVFESACKEDEELVRLRDHLAFLSAHPSLDWPDEIYGTLLMKLQTEQKILSRQIEIFKGLDPNKVGKHLRMLLSLLRETA